MHPLAPRPLTDLQFHALLPFILPRSPRGRRLADLRTRMDAIFHIAATPDPWRTLPERFGKPDTVSRYFRRLTQGGLWQALLRHMELCGPGHPLSEIRPLIFRACRRAARLLGIAFIRLIRQCGLTEALPGPPHLVADPILSETCASIPLRVPAHRSRPGITALLAQVGMLKALWRRAGGRARLSRAQRLAWS